MNLEDLNEKQREAVLYNDGPLLIIAGAGAGKTKTLTTKIAFLIEEKDVSPYNILAITFTNKAAKEMKDRLFLQIGNDAKKLTVSTFHSFGLKLLRENYERLGYDKNFVIMDSDDSLTVVKKIISSFPDDRVIMLPQDAYYKDQGNISLDERKLVNYDHPSAFDNELLKEHIKQLSLGHSVDLPVYSYITYTRQKDSIHIEPGEIIIVEGILVLEDPILRDLLDIKIFVDAPADVRFIRRLKRDIMERGRSVDSVIEQYMNVVRPMHMQFVEPSKWYADIIVPEGGQNEVAIDLITTKIRSLLMGI